MTMHISPNMNPHTFSPHPKAKLITVLILQFLVAIAFLAAASIELYGPPEILAMFDKLNLGQGFRYLTSSLEITGALLLLFPRTVLYGAALLILIMLGAIAAHLFILGGNPLPAILLLLLSATIAFLRRA